MGTGNPDIGLRLQIDITPAVEALKSFLSIAGDVGGQIDKLISGEMIKPSFVGIDAEIVHLQETLSQYASTSAAQTIAANEQVGKSFEDLNVPVEEFTNTLGSQVPASVAQSTITIEALRKELQDLQAQLVRAPIGSDEFTQLAQKANAVQQQLDQAQLSIQRVGGRSTNARMLLQQFNWVLSDTPSFAMNFRFGMMAIGNNLDMVSNALLNLQMEAKNANTTVMALLKQSLTPMTWWMFGLTAAITAAQVLPAFFSKTKKEAKDANAELEKFNRELKTMSDENLLAARNEYVGQQRDAIKAANEVKDQMRKTPFMYGVTLEGVATWLQMFTSADDTAKKIEEKVKAINAVLDQRREGKFGPIEQLKQQIDDYDKMLNDANLKLGDPNIQQIIDDRAKAQWNLNEATMTSEQQADRDSQRIEHWYNLGQMTADEYIKQLRAQESLTLDANKRLQIEQKVHDVIQKEADLEIKRQVALKSYGEQQTKAEEDLWLSLKQLQIEVIDDEFEKRREAEEWRHTQAMANIRKEAAERENISPSGELIGDSATKANLENQLNARTNRLIDTDFSYQLARARAQGIADQTQRENALYQMELQHIQETEKNEQLAEARINALKVEHETKLAEIERSQFEESISSAEQLGQILADAFQGAGSGAQKIVAILRVALEVARQINILNNLKPGESSFSGILGLVGSAISIGSLALADEGAVVTKPGLVRVGQAGVPELMMPMKYITPQRVIPPSVMASSLQPYDDSALRAEVRALGRSIERMQIVIEGTTDYNKYRMFLRDFERIERGRNG